MKPGNARDRNSLHPSQHFFLTVCTKMKNQQTELTPADASSWKIYQVHKVSYFVFVFQDLEIFLCVWRKRKTLTEKSKILKLKMSKRVSLYALFLW